MKLALCLRSKELLMLYLVLIISSNVFFFYISYLTNVNLERHSNCPIQYLGITYSVKSNTKEKALESITQNLNQNMMLLTVITTWNLKFFSPVILLTISAILRLANWIKAFTFTLSNTNDPVLSNPEKPFENPSWKTIKVQVLWKTHSQ